MTADSSLFAPPRTLDQIVRWLLVLGIFFSPTVFDLGAAKPFDVVKAAAAWVFGWLAAGVFVLRLLRRETRPGASLSVWLALALLASTAVSAALSRTPWTALFGWYGRYTGLATVLVLTVTYLVVAHTYSARASRLVELLAAFSAGALVLTAYILVQFFHLDPIHWVTPAHAAPGQRYFGTMGNANFAGGYLGVTFPCVVYAWRRAKRMWHRFAVVVWGGAHLWCLWLTSARNGVVALGAAGLVALFLFWRRTPLWMKLGAVTAAVSALALAAAVVLHSPAPRPHHPVNGEGFLRSQTIRVRAYWWQAAFRIFEHHPVLGTGPDTFVSEYERYLSPKAAPLGDSETADKPHNVFLDRLATTGGVGVALYLALLLVVAVRTWRRFVSLDPPARSVVATALAMLGGYVGQAVFSIDVVPLALTGWVLLGALASVADPPGGRGNAESRGPTRKVDAASGGVVALTIAVLALTALVATLGTFPLMADHESHTASRLADVTAPTYEVLAHYRRAMRLDPFEPIYPGAAGDFLERRASSDRTGRRRQADLGEAIRFYRKMLSLQPDYHLWMMTLGHAIGELAPAGGARFEEAEGYLRRAEQLAPYDWRVPTAWGDVLLRKAALDKSVPEACAALAQYQRAARLRKQEPAPYIGMARTYLALGQLEAAVSPLRHAARTSRRRGDRTAEELLTSTLRLIRSGRKVPVATC